MLLALLLAGCQSPEPVRLGHLGAYAHGEMGVGLSVGRVSPDATNTEVAVQTRSAAEGAWQDASSVSIDWTGPDSLDVALVADNSGSEGDHVADIQAAAAAFVDRVLGRAGDDRIAMVRVSTVASTLTPLTDDPATLDAAVDGMFSSNGWTALWDGVRVGNELLAEGASAQADQVCANQSLRSIVVFTDGADNNSSGQHETSLEDDGVDTELADLDSLEVHGSATAIHAVGIGREVDEDALRTLAEGTGGAYSSVDGYGDLLDALDSAAVRLGGEVPVCFQPASCEHDQARVTVSVDDGTAVETTTFELDYTPSNCGCTLTQGYWKNHEEAWPTDTLRLGSVDYDQAALLTLLRTPVRGDTSMNLAHQLIAAKLNVEAGAWDGEVADTIDASDAWLAARGSGPLPYKVKGEATGTALAAALDAYNNGDTGPGHCD
jgi:hypothetical protein